MDNGVLVALIEGACIAAPVIINTMLQHKRTYNLIDYRLKQVEEKVAIHNNIERRLYAAETELKTLREVLERLMEKIGG